MGKSHKRKNRGSSEGNTENNSGCGKKKKGFGAGGPSEGTRDSEKTVSVSDVLNQTNSILYDENNESFNSDTVFAADSNITEVKKQSGNCTGADRDSKKAGNKISTQKGTGLENADKRDSDPVDIEANSTGRKGTRADLAVKSSAGADLKVNSKMASGSAANSGEPTNADIMTYLKKMDTKLSNMESKIGTMDKRLCALEEMKVKVDGLDGELKKLWCVIDKQSKKTEERLRVVEDKAESVDFDVAQWNSRVAALQKEKDVLKDEVTYLQSQSMRNNLIFSNIPENTDNIESNEECEVKVRKFLEEKMKIAKDLVDKIKLERVHRIGQKVRGKHRNIVAKFHDFKEREMVRKQWKTLEGTMYYVSEQFPRDIVEKRKKLVPRMRAARADNKKAWIAYDTLYIDGKAVRD